MRAVYPGSFDPITLGHIDIIKRISNIFDEVVVLISHSAEKQSLFTVEERMKLIHEALKDIKNVKVDHHQGLTVDYVRQAKAKVIVRGLRAVVDFEYELAMGNVNRKMAPDIETLLVNASPEYYFISSRMVKDIAKNKGDLNGFVPKHVIKPLQSKFAKSMNKGGKK
ncbi:MAG: phosphopantetheine adenylyltransferase [Oligoflexia bacterium]|nr:MAG: phosphopantetheine adenylyltransferase [Oligoflexia bacterium]